MARISYKSKPKENKRTMNTEMRNQVDEHKSELDEEVQEKRRDDWGKQFDMWLIRAARKSRELIFTTRNYIGKEGQKQRVGIPLRVDKYFVQVKWEDGSEEWFSKNYLISCKDNIKPEVEE